MRNRIQDSQKALFDIIGNVLGSFLFHRHPSSQEILYQIDPGRFEKIFSERFADAGRFIFWQMYKAYEWDFFMVFSPSVG